MWSTPPRRAFAATSLALAAFLTGCSAPDDAASSTATRTADQTALSDKDAYLAGTPAPFDPAWFAHGEFVGAIDIQFRGDRTSASATAADAKYNDYFQGSYTPPAAGTRNVVRLTAFEDPRDGARLLHYGAVIDTITAPNELVIGLHNTTEIEGGVELNGEVFEGRVGNAAGIMDVGDRLTIWTQDPNFADLVNRYDFEVVAAEDGGAYTLADSNSGLEEFIYAPGPGGDVIQLTSYTCWPPNQLDQRMVSRLHLVSSSIEVGSVSPAGPDPSDPTS